MTKENIETLQLPASMHTIKGNPFIEYINLKFLYILAKSITIEKDLLEIPENAIIYVKNESVKKTLIEHGVSSSKIKILTTVTGSETEEEEEEEEEEGEKVYIYVDEEGKDLNYEKIQFELDKDAKTCALISFDPSLTEYPSFTKNSVVVIDGTTEEYAIVEIKGVSEEDVEEGLYRDFQNPIGFDNLTSLTLPSTITKIGRMSFSYCIFLSELQLSSQLEEIGDLTFAYCYGLNLKKLPENVTNIGNYAFMCCYNLSLEELPSKLEFIGEYAFQFCSSLSLKKLPSSLKEIGKGVFGGCIILDLKELPSNLETIGEGAFSQCVNLKLTTLPSKISKIGSGAFESCYALSLKSLPENIQIIESGTFLDCWNIAIEELPSTLETIEEDAFRRCYKLNIQSAPESLIKIGKRAFRDCIGLSTINCTSITDTGFTIETDAFKGCDNCLLRLDGTLYDFLEENGRIDSENKLEGATVKGVTYIYVDENGYDITYGQKVKYDLTKGDSRNTCALSSGFGNTTVSEYPKFNRHSVVKSNVDGTEYEIISINALIFTTCASLNLNSLPNSLESIGQYAFQKCTSLALTYLPESLKNIGNNAFFECTSLNLEYFPTSLETIGNNAFNYCTGLKRIKCTGIKELIIGSATFSNCTSECILEMSQELFDYIDTVLFRITQDGEDYYIDAAKIDIVNEEEEE